MNRTRKPRRGVARGNRQAVRVADEVWIATALLHREQPDRPDFAVAEIVDRARRERLTPELRPGVYVHAVLHSVANRAPNPARYRMLVETAPDRRRLYRPGDPTHQARRSAKVAPLRSAIPLEYHALIDWYENEYARPRTVRPEADPLLALRGSGRKLWSEEHADEYVRRLREGWE
jgi:hypothetical protein